jgi:hypothetical protein
MVKLASSGVAPNWDKARKVESSKGKEKAQVSYTSYCLLIPKWHLAGLDRLQQDRFFSKIHLFHFVIASRNFNRPS